MTEMMNMGEGKSGARGGDEKEREGERKRGGNKNLNTEEATCRDSMS